VPEKDGGILLYGAIRDDRGEPVVVQGVLLEREETSEQRHILEGKAAYSFAGLLPGRVKLRLDHYEYLSYSDEIELSSSRPLHRHDVTLTSSPLLEIVFESADGEEWAAPLSARVGPGVFPLVAVATREPPDALLPNVLDGYPTHLGVYRGEMSPGLPAHGTLVPRQPLPVHVSAVLRNRVLSTVRVTDASLPVKFFLSGDDLAASLGSLRCRVVSGIHGRPVSAPAHLELLHDTYRKATSDEAGRLDLEGCLPGIFELVISASEHAPYRRSVRIHPGQATDLGDLVLGRFTTIEGRILHHDGEPAQGQVRIDEADPRAGPHDLRRRTVARLQRDGGFRHLAPEGSLVLSVEEGSSVLHTQIAVQGEEMKLGDLRIPPLQDLSITTSEGAELPHWVVLANENGVPFWVTVARPGRTTTLRLPQGSYELRLHEDETVLRRRTFVLKQHPVHLRLDAEGSK
jgi:hypothetical protein